MRSILRSKLIQTVANVRSPRKLSATRCSYQTGTAVFRVMIVDWVPDGDTTKNSVLSTFMTLQMQMF